MKTIGLIGGMSWESSLHYYRIINEAVRSRLGGLHSAQTLMFSVDFSGIEEMQARGEWRRAGEVLADAAERLERGGADLIVLCTNTMHKVAEAIERRVRIPLLHIADATGAKIRAAGLSRVGLLGTRFTMEQDFYRDRLRERLGIEVLVPGEDERSRIHRIIYDELCLGTVRPDSKRTYLDAVRSLVERGAGGIILGCTEIMLLLQQQDIEVPVFDTTAIHAMAAVDLALATSAAG